MLDSLNERRTLNAPSFQKLQLPPKEIPMKNISLVRPTLLLALMTLLLASHSLLAGDKKFRIGIVGGGIAGVATLAKYAEALKGRNDVELVLLEKEEVLGGNALNRKMKNANGEEVEMDFGPQFMGKGGPWQAYEDFMKKHDLYDEGQISQVASSLEIFHENKKGKKVFDFVSPALSKSFLKHVLRSPIKGIGNSLQFVIFYQTAHKTLENKDSKKDLTVKEWVKKLKVTKKFKKKVVYPFLAATMGRSIKEIENFSAKGIFGLFAYAKLLGKHNFYVQDRSMGEVIKELGRKIENQHANVSIRTNSPVSKIRKGTEGSGHQVWTANGQEAEYFDHLVLATHADVSHHLLGGALAASTEKCLHQRKNLSLPDQILATLGKLKYEDTTVVVHPGNVEGQTHPSGDAFLNIRRGGKDDYQTYTVSNQLGKVENKSTDKRPFEGLTRTTGFADKLTEDFVERAGLIEGSEVATFRHPVVTPDFHRGAAELLEKTYGGDLHFTGAWVDPIMESQASAIEAAQRSLEAFKQGSGRHLFPNEKE